MENDKNVPVVIGQVGHSFDIYLESMVGSTGYGWCLKSIPEGVELISTENIPMKTGISSVRQIFTFAAVKPLNEGLMEFELLCLYDLSCESADQTVFQIHIHAGNENDLLMKEIGGNKFVKGAGTMMHATPAIPYGFVNSDKALLVYGFPPQTGNCSNVIHSNTNCLLKYGTPFGGSTDETECNLKYGYPIHMKYGYPTPIYKYGFPINNAAGKKLEVKSVPENSANCVVKYGTPGGIGNNIGDCRIKYGFPVSSEKMKNK